MAREQLDAIRSRRQLVHAAPTPASQCAAQASTQQIQLLSGQRGCIHAGAGCRVASARRSHQLLGAVHHRAHVAQLVQLVSAQQHRRLPMLQLGGGRRLHG